MYECPNCAGNLKFDIKAQMLFCEHCESFSNPYSVEKQQDAEESQYFDATIYTCPQCGGKLLCDENTAATFCCYCGGSTVLTSRISKMKRPEYIIPFQKTKEDCKRSYEEMVKGAFFAPKEFKDANALDRFRAIYMPYWVCDAEADEDIEFEGISYTQRGDYRQTHHVGFSTRVQSTFEGMTFDASKAFPDQLSNMIEPFFLSQKMPFTASYFSGFYADSNDVDARDYRYLTESIAADQCCEDFRAIYPNYVFGEKWGSVSLRDALDIHEVKEHLTMFPVWFLSYRKKDKVAYGVMNGQTGKVAVELPIDIKKFVGVALLVSIPIILLLNLLLVIKPNILLGIMIILTSIMGLMVHERTSQVLDKNFYEDFQMVVEDKDIERQAKKKVNNFVENGLIPRIYAIFTGTVAYCFNADVLSAFSPSLILAIIEIPFLIFLIFKIKKSYRLKDVSFYNEASYKEQWRGKLMYMTKPLAIILMALIVLFINPVSDIIYYGAVLIGIGMMLWTMIDLIRIQNKLIMRPLPQFNTRGGDEDAYKML